MLETPTRLGSEYQLLATLSVDISTSSSCVIAQMPENKWKNRYINILPCKYAENCFVYLFHFVYNLFGDVSSSDLMPSNYRIISRYNKLKWIWKEMAVA
jgi:hypothetical protein